MTSHHFKGLPPAFCLGDIGPHSKRFTSPPNCLHIFSHGSKSLYTSNSSSTRLVRANRFGPNCSLKKTYIVVLTKRTKISQSNNTQKKVLSEKTSKKLRDMKPKNVFSLRRLIAWHLRVEKLTCKTENGFNWRKYLQFFSPLNSCFRTI